MSYLIALYVYYHGNNLQMFGFVKGKDEAEPKNEGLKQPDEIDRSLVDENLINAVKKQEMLKQRDDWDGMMRSAIERSQRQSMTLYNRGLVNNSLLENTPDDYVDNEYEEEGHIDLSIFNSLNGF